MKIFVTILAILNGGYMLIDGLYVMLNKKYIGPEKPGPWANFFYKFDINVFRLGPVFVVFGILWITWLYAFWTHQSWAFGFGIAVSILTLWYLPVGTFFSIVILLLLIFARKKLGL